MPGVEMICIRPGRKTAILVSGKNNIFYWMWQMGNQVRHNFNALTSSNCKELCINFGASGHAFYYLSFLHGKNILLFVYLCITQSG